jgi:hypothetical protein
MIAFRDVSPTPASRSAPTSRTRCINAAATATATSLLFPDECAIAQPNPRTPRLLILYSLKMFA